MADAPSEDPGRFLGRPDLYQQWVEENRPPQNPHLCYRHWMPCPVEGRNGILVSIILVGEAFAFVPANVSSPSALNSWFANQLTPTCCRLGDEKMTWLWWMVGLPHGTLCTARPPKSMGGVRVCWRRLSHIDEHEWQRPYIPGRCST